jgi:hypothetical protein
MLQPFATPRTLHIYLRQAISVLQFEMKVGLHFVDVAEIQEAVTNELKKVQKDEFLAAFQKLYDCAKAFIYASGAYFE